MYHDVPFFALRSGGFEGVKHQHELENREGNDTTGETFFS